MIRNTSLLIFVLALFSGVYATTYSLRKFTVTTYPNASPRIFLYANGTMHALISSGVPATRSTYDEWVVGHDFSTSGITNVHPESDFAGVGYVTLDGLHTITRVFYQTTSGDIRSTFTNDTSWTNDPTVIATGVPYGAPIFAFRDTHNDATHEVIVVQYFDSNNLLTQRTATVDTGNWGTPTTVTT